jgi:hypothetical protein
MDLLSIGGIETAVSFSDLTIDNLASGAAEVTYGDTGNSILVLNAANQLGFDDFSFV